MYTYAHKYIYYFVCTHACSQVHTHTLSLSLCQITQHGMTHDTHEHTLVSASHVHTWPQHWNQRLSRRPNIQQPGLTYGRQPRNQRTRIERVRRCVAFFTANLGRICCNRSAGLQHSDKRTGDYVVEVTYLRLHVCFE